MGAVLELLLFLPPSWRRWGGQKFDLNFLHSFQFFSLDIYVYACTNKGSDKYHSFLGSNAHFHFFSQFKRTTNMNFRGIVFWRNEVYVEFLCPYAHLNLLPLPKWGKGGLFLACSLADHSSCTDIFFFLWDHVSLCLTRVQQLCPVAKPKKEAETMLFSHSCSAVSITSYLNLDLAWLADLRLVWNVTIKDNLCY